MIHKLKVLLEILQAINIYKCNPANLFETYCNLLVMISCLKQL